MRPLLAFVVSFPLCTSAFAGDIDEPHLGADHNQVHGVRGEIHGSTDQYASLGVGFRVEIPIVPNGVLSGVDDEITLAPGAEIFFVDYNPSNYNYGAYIVPLAVFDWNFYVSDHWSVFPELGLALYVGVSDAWRTNYIAPAGGIGARYHFNGRNSFVMRLASPGGLQLGLTF